MYSCTMLMSADRNGVSRDAGAMMMMICSSAGTPAVMMRLSRGGGWSVDALTDEGKERSDQVS
jgi:hypothetical protein